MTVSSESERLLRDALERMSDPNYRGGHGVSAWATLAGVSRSTANRAPAGLLRAVRELDGTRGGADPGEPTEAVRLKRDLRQERSRRHRERVDHEERMRVMAQHIRALSMENAALRASLDEEGKVRSLDGRASSRR